MWEIYNRVFVFFFALVFQKISESEKLKKELCESEAKRAIPNKSIKWIENRHYEAMI